MKFFLSLPLHLIRPPSLPLPSFSDLHCINMSVNNTNFLSPYASLCYQSTVGRYTLTVISLSYGLFTVPLSVFVLYVGFQRLVSPAVIMTHSDFFTYNMAIVELFITFSQIFYYCSSYTDLPGWIAVDIASFIWPAQTLLPILVCLERYLAVVHPIIYRRLKQAGGVRLRNISTGLIWLNCFLWFVLLVLLDIPSVCRRTIATTVLILSLVVMVFCSLSVVRVLISPRPGKVGRYGAQVDQTKRRAIFTVLLIMVVLWLRFGGNVIVIVFRFSTLLSVRCLGEALTFVFFLPCGVMLPLQFLYRSGKLPKNKQGTGSG